MNYKIILGLFALSLLFSPAAHANGVLSVKEKVQEFKEAKKDLKIENKNEWEKMIKENKQEREDFQDKVKEMIVSNTPEELKQLRPSIKAERKVLFKENKEQRKNMRQQFKSAMLELRKKFFGQ